MRTLVVTKALGGFFVSSESVSYPHGSGQEPITRGASNFHVLVAWRFHGPVYFQNGFGANFEYLLNSTNESAKPTDLKMIFFAFI